jgi:hypothetical protein
MMLACIDTRDVKRARRGGHVKRPGYVGHIADIHMHVSAFPKISSDTTMTMWTCYRDLLNTLPELEFVCHYM